MDNSAFLETQEESVLYDWSSRTLDWNPQVWWIAVIRHSDVWMWLPRGGDLTSLVELSGYNDCYLVLCDSDTGFWMLIIWTRY